MARAMRPATADDERAVVEAVAHLRAALGLLSSAGSARTCERVRAAIRSADGARRHVGHRRLRTELGEVGAPAP